MQTTKRLEALERGTYRELIFAELTAFTVRACNLFSRDEAFAFLYECVARGEMPEPWPSRIDADEVLSAHWGEYCRLCDALELLPPEVARRALTA